MAVDPVEVDNPSTSRATVTVMPFSNGKKKRVVKHSPNCENKWVKCILVSQDYNLNLQFCGISEGMLAQSKWMA